MLATLFPMYLSVCATHIWFFWVKVPKFNFFEFDAEFGIPLGAWGCFVDYRAAELGPRVLVCTCPFYVQNQSQDTTFLWLCNRPSGSHGERSVFRTGDELF